MKTVAYNDFTPPLPNFQLGLHCKLPHFMGLLLRHIRLPTVRHDDFIQNFGFRGYPFNLKKSMSKIFTMKFCLKNMQPNRLRMRSFPNLVIFILKLILI